MTVRYGVPRPTSANYYERVIGDAVRLFGKLAVESCHSCDRPTEWLSNSALLCAITNW